MSDTNNTDCTQCRTIRELDGKDWYHLCVIKAELSLARTLKTRTQISVFNPPTSTSEFSNIQFNQKYICRTITCPASVTSWSCWLKDNLTVPSHISPRVTFMGLFVAKVTHSWIYDDNLLLSVRDSSPKTTSKSVITVRSNKFGWTIVQIPIFFYNVSSILTFCTFSWQFRSSWH